MAAVELNFKKFLVYLLIFSIFIGVMIAIFYKPVQATEGSSLNTELPDPKKKELHQSKLKAYETEKYESEQANKMRNMDQWISELKEQESNEKIKIKEPATDGLSSARQQIRIITEASQIEAENIELKERLRRLESNQQRQNALPSREISVDERIKMIEQTYKAASNLIAPKDTTTKEVVEHYNKIGVLSDNMVSTLDNNEATGRFNEVKIDGVSTTRRNTIKACISQNMTIEDGQRIMLRLLEPLVVDNTVVPRSHIIAGKVKLQSDRLQVDVNTIEYEGKIIPVKLTVYDSDGIEGLYCHTTASQSATKELAGNVANGIASGISVSTSAGSQLAQGVTRGVFTTAGQVLQKNVRKVKIHVKENYEVMLFEKNSNKK